MAREHWSERLQRFDRRWIFLVMAVAVVVPLYFPLGLPARPDPMTKAAYNAVEALPTCQLDPVTHQPVPGSPRCARVFISIDLDPASTPELEPFYRAVVLHLKRKHAQLVIATTWYAGAAAGRALPARDRRCARSRRPAPTATPARPTAPTSATSTTSTSASATASSAIIQAFGTDLRSAFDGRADDGTPLDRIPMMQGLNKLKDFDLIVLVSGRLAGRQGVRAVRRHPREAADGRGLHRGVDHRSGALLPDRPAGRAGRRHGRLGRLRAAGRQARGRHRRRRRAQHRHDGGDPGHRLRQRRVLRRPGPPPARRPVMTALPWIDVVGYWIGIFLTFWCLSFLYKDNPFYKLVEHLFIGVSVGYLIVLQYGDNIEPKVIDAIFGGDLDGAWLGCGSSPWSWW
jgi:hypothetical protein